MEAVRHPRGRQVSAATSWSRRPAGTRRWRSPAAARTRSPARSRCARLSRWG